MLSTTPNLCADHSPCQEPKKPILATLGETTGDDDILYVETIRRLSGIDPAVQDWLTAPASAAQDWLAALSISADETHIDAPAPNKIH